MTRSQLARWALSIGLVAALGLANKSAQACSPAPDFKGPETNFELAQMADVILIGTVTSWEEKLPFDSKIVVRPDKLLKGEKLPRTVRIPGLLSGHTFQSSDENVTVYATRSDPFDLWRPNAEVWIGGCVRQTFAKDAQLLLFFKKEGAELRYLQATFGRSAEDVSGPDALWAKAVAIYAQIGSLPLAEQKTALTAEMLKLRKDDFMKRENILLADDIERQLAGVGPVSHFIISQSTPDEKRWIENIVNESYQAQVQFERSTARPKESRPLWILPWVIGGLFAICGLSFLAFRRIRRANLDKI